MKRNKIMLSLVVFLAMIIAATGCKEDSKEKGRSGRSGEEKEKVEATIDTTEETAEGPVETEETVSVIDETDKDDENGPQNYSGVHPESLNLPGGYVRHGNYVYTDGHVESGYDTYFDANDNEILTCYINSDGEIVSSEYYEYDDSGRLIREEIWRSGGLPDGKLMLYTYGDDGLLELVTDGPVNGEPNYQYTYEYDDQGRMIWEHCIDVANEGEIYGYEYVYDDDGTYTVYYWANNIVSGEFEKSEGQYRRFSADGRIVEDVREVFTPYEYTVYYYDENGKLMSEKKEKGKKRNPDGSIVYEYDERGRLTSVINYSASGAAGNYIRYDYENL
ncbi:MAG: hypothetical protein J5379_04140 [Clostridiales bacterium]|nr:hypothetical protein [Clostridiales bacterium]